MDDMRGILQELQQLQTVKTPYPNNMTRDQCLFDTAVKIASGTSLINNSLTYHELCRRNFKMAEAMLNEFDKRREGE